MCYALGRRRYTVVEDAEADSGPRNTGARTRGMQDVQSNVIAGAGGGNVNMLQQQLPHFLMLCGAATQRKTGIATLLPGEDVMRLDMANAHSLSGTVVAKLCSAG